MLNEQTDDWEEEDEEPSLMSCGMCGCLEFHLFSNGFCFCADCGCQVSDEPQEISIH